VAGVARGEALTCLQIHFSTMRKIIPGGWDLLDTEKEIADLGKKVEGLEHDVANLNGWQKTQNGALLRVDDKVDKLKLWIISVLAGVVVSIFVNLVKG